MLQWVLRPFARYCLRHGFELQECIEALKLSLVQAARASLEAEHAEPTISKLSLMTGVHRKDVTRLMQAGTQDGSSGGMIVRVLTEWETGAEYRTVKGSPRVLGVRGVDSEFAQLVASVSQDINPYTVLNEMERLGVVERTARGVKMKRAEVLPRSDLDRLEDGYRMLALDLDDLMRTVEDNLARRDKESKHHLKTEFDSIPLEKMDELQRFINMQSRALHRRIRGMLSAAEKAPVRKSTSAERVDSELGRRVRIAFLSFLRIDESKDAFHENF